MSEILEIANIISSLFSLDAANMTTDSEGNATSITLTGEDITIQLTSETARIATTRLVTLNVRLTGNVGDDLTRLTRVLLALPTITSLIQRIIYRLPASLPCAPETLLFAVSRTYGVEFPSAIWSAARKVEYKPVYALVSRAMLFGSAHPALAPLVDVLERGLQRADDDVLSIVDALNNCVDIVDLVEHISYDFDAVESATRKLIEYAFDSAEEMTRYAEEKLASVNIPPPRADPAVLAATAPLIEYALKRADTPEFRDKANEILADAAAATLTETLRRALALAALASMYHSLMSYKHDAATLSALTREGGLFEALARAIIERALNAGKTIETAVITRKIKRKILRLVRKI